MAKPVTRRGFLLAAGLVLAGCSTARSERVASPTGSSPASAPPSWTPSPTSEASPTALPLDEVRARFSQARPTAWGMDLAGILTGGDPGALTLTFDACGGPRGSAVDRDLIDLLTRLQVKATLFLNERWIRANVSYARELADNELFELGNHGTRHCPVCVSPRSAYGIAGTGSVDAAIAEVADNHASMSEILGVAPRLFRAGTAHYDDVGVAICQALGETPVGFSINGDAGATYTRAQVVHEAGRARLGDIVISHMNQPRGDTAEGYAELLPRWIDQGVAFSHLPRA